jgi:hypothetical protein
VNADELRKQFEAETGKDWRTCGVDYWHWLESRLIEAEGKYNEQFSRRVGEITKMYDDAEAQRKIGVKEGKELRSELSSLREGREKEYEVFVFWLGVNGYLTARPLPKKIVSDFLHRQSEEETKYDALKRDSDKWIAKDGETIRMLAVDRFEELREAFEAGSRGWFTISPNETVYTDSSGDYLAAFLKSKKEK